MLGLAGCGGSGSDAVEPPPPPPPVQISKAEAVQLLNQATFGALDAESQNVINLSPEGWIDNQMLQPVSLQLQHVQDAAAGTIGMDFLFQVDRVDIW